MVHVSRSAWGAPPLTVFVALALAIAACTSGPGASPPSSPSATAGPSAVSTPAPSGASPAGQTDTDWGRIWDDLPPGFPAYPGAVPTETGEGPATARLQLESRVETAADWWQEALEAAGYGIEARNGPLEDGSIVIDAIADGGCRVQAAIAPRGGVTIATIFVGALCPFS